MKFKKYRIGQLGKVVTGKTPSTKNLDYWSGEFPFITIPDLNNSPYIRKSARMLSQLGAASIQNQLLPANTVLMSCIATVGKCGITTQPSFTNQQINAVIPNSLIEPKFMYYLFRNLGAEMARFGSGGTVYLNISKSLFESMEVSIPTSIEIQAAISNILEVLDSKIENNNALSKTLGDIAQTIFKSWFIDFDPVKAKMNGEKLVGMDDETAALFPDSFEESELGLIPKGWKSGSLGDLFELQGGFAFKSSSWTDTGVPVIKIGSVKPGFIDFGQVSYVSEEFANEIPGDYRLTAGSLVVGLTGYVGEVGLARTHFPVPLINQRVAKFKSKSGDWKLPFIYCVTRNPKFKATVEELATGTAQQNVSNAQILSIPIIKPTKEVLTYFEDMLKSYFEQIINLADENETLKGLRDSLLPRLISGELQIPEEMLAS
jgi:type I restriction enzyme S subunit